MRKPQHNVIDSANRASRPPSAEPIADEFHHKPRLLVVDDDGLVRVMAQLGLERHGFEVCAAPSGSEAIELYRAQGNTFAAVLLDVQMPGLDGPETLDALRRLNPAVVVCFMSGDTGAYAPEELLQRGASRVIFKPFRLDHLASILLTLLQDGGDDGCLSNRVLHSAIDATS
jgi:CheY-like chemotaxis protein